jgi:hypothetical protein
MTKNGDDLQAAIAKQWKESTGAFQIVLYL